MPSPLPKTLRKKHATAIAGERTVCGRAITPRIAVDDGFPDCARCLRAIGKVCCP